ncbi:OmpA family protein [Neisseriaceae bacterium PsAf]|nr:OmpA family protein [Neisseriaceae bacterium PsAf]
MLKKVFLLSTVMLALSACVTTADGEQRVARTVTYGAGGAGIGAALGAIFGDSSKNTRNSAIAGGVVGATVGAIMDIQEAKLKKATAGSGVSVDRVAEDKILLTMPENVTFDTNKYNLKPRSIEILNGIIPVLKENQGQRVNITGHTDNTGNDAINDPLSVNRAYSVYNYLSSNGITNMNYTGVGSRQPIDTNATPAGRQNNRRVEIQLIAVQ